MRPSAILLAVLCLLVAFAPDARADRKGVLDKIAALLDDGELDEAKRMLDFFLEKNPGDADLKTLRDRWRVQKGDLGGLLEAPEDRDALRDACWRIVAATWKANPDEWSAALEAGEPERARTFLEGSEATGSPEDRRIAGELLAKMDAPPTGGLPRDVPEDRVEVALRSANPDQALWAIRTAVERGFTGAGVRREVRRLASSADAPDEIRYEARHAELALGIAKDEQALRKELIAELFSGDIRKSVLAGTVLVREPGDGKKALQDLLARIETEDAAGRARPTLLEIGLAELARRQEPGARAFLEARLDDPGVRVDAARALGALGDDDAVPALVTYVTSPSPKEEGATSGGLGFLGGNAEGMKDVATAEALRPALVGALAILRLTVED